mmetsp:Transcript_100267/g.239060  ORF Transcript_100267/g.239060 Transcript_100267/m.239060 type:complete len:133 (+) Transcript_100267:40-438(+)
MLSHGVARILERVGLASSCTSCPQVCKSAHEEVVEVVDITPVIPQKQSASGKFYGRSVLNRLQGCWFRQDGQMIAQIIDSLVIFSNNSVAVLSPRSESQVCLSLGGDRMFGTFIDDAQASLRWSDGDVWLRK